jgi:hypothetical protein
VPVTASSEGEAGDDDGGMRALEEDIGGMGLTGLEGGGMGGGATAGPTELRGIATTGKLGKDGLPVLAASGVPGTRFRPHAELSTYEQAMMAKAVQRQREGLVHASQKVGVREYVGSGFSAAPAALSFQDLEVGKCFQRTITLTNVSLSFNSFKLLPLPDAIRDLFTITFAPPGAWHQGGGGG